MRLDIYLVENGYYKTRSKAQAAIKSGDVLVSGIKAKASDEVDINSKIEIVKNSCPYVSRGGLKLECAIKEFQLDFKDKVVLDIGASTGGFSDCALKFGAKKVIAVDVGTNQLDESLRSDKRVEFYENTNILDFKTDTIFDFVVMDVSFVRIEYLLSGINNFISELNDEKLQHLLKKMSYQKFRLELPKFKT